MSFTTVENVALYLNREIDDLTDLELAQVEMLIPYVDGIISDYCGWEMLATDYTNKRYDGSGTDVLDLRVSPVNTITQIRIRANDGTFTDITDGVEILEGGLIQFLPYATTDSTTFTAGIKNIFVTFNAGYATTAVPYALVYAATSLIVEHFYKIIDENTGTEDEKFAEVSFKNNRPVITPPVARMLDRYRLVSIF